VTAVFPVILSGGAGTRLWPLSREMYPKQLLALTSRFSMLQETAQRLGPVAGARPPIVVCNEAHRFTVAEQLRALGIEPSAILLEPAGRNTAPAVALAALKARELNAEAIIIVAPADHVIRDARAFQAAADIAVGLAGAGKLVTFGIVAHAPETGYGYIRRGDVFVIPGVATVVAAPHRRPREARELALRIAGNARMYLPVLIGLRVPGVTDLRPVSHARPGFPRRATDRH